MNRLRLNATIEEEEVDVEMGCAARLDAESSRQALASSIKPLLLAIAHDCEVATWEDRINTYFEIQLPAACEELTDMDINIVDGHIFIRSGR